MLALVGGAEAHDQQRPLIPSVKMPGAGEPLRALDEVQGRAVRAAAAVDGSLTKGEN
jgi:hypothetical protein